MTKAESIEKVSLTKYFNKKETAGIVENDFGLIKSTLEDGECFLTTHDFREENRLLIDRGIQ